MTRLFEELDHQATPMGDISLRRRRDPVLDVDVFEAKLGDEFLMSSLFTVAEVALADLGLAATAGPELDVVVGGLGLGYTARAALDDPRVASVTVVDALAEVIGWHERGLVPLGAGLAGDDRCRFLHGDFFALVADGTGFGADPSARHHAILLDVDHAPDRLLHPSHGGFYTPEGIGRLGALLHPGGTFALWSDDLPDPAFLEVLAGTFATVDAHVVPFPNPYAGDGTTNTNSVYVATLG